MSQFSQFSESGLSDIISDVDRFIEEHGIIEDVGQLMHAIPNENVDSSQSNEEEEFKPVPAECFGPADYPPSLYHEVQFPPDQPVNLGTEEYPGPFNFEVLIIPNEQKSPWEYSTKLNKIFIGINLKFPVAFSLKQRPANVNLYVRATPVFSQSQYFQEIVHRCIGHQHAQDPSNQGLPAHVFQHIIRCSNEKTHYFGDKSDGTRPNIVIPLDRPQLGTDIVKEFYHFVCKNSCPLGLNRKPIDVIFTLENASGEILGRHVISVRICSCPKRDREKEEKDVDKNKPPTKKRRMANKVASTIRTPSDLDADTRVYSVNVVGKNNYVQALTACKNMMAAEILKLQGQGGADAPFKKCFNDLCNLLDKAKAE